MNSQAFKGQTWENHSFHLFLEYLFFPTTTTRALPNVNPKAAENENCEAGVRDSPLAIVATPPRVSAMLLMRRASMQGQLDKMPQMTRPTVFVIPTADSKNAASVLFHPPCSALSESQFSVIQVKCTFTTT